MEWTSQDDGSGTFIAGNPTRTLGIDVRTKTGVSVATRTIVGTLTSASGTIAMTDGSDTANTGYSTSYAKVDDGTASPRADITITFPDSSIRLWSVSWIARDISVAGGIPAGGGGK